ncbi:MAG TPA: DUF6498-containing protein [Thermoanaerobaculia bacterium]|nr:DUF6498-containing protein [Thermoanaerobaculia bacterium]
MAALLRLLQSLGLNAVPAAGVFFGDWSLSTAFLLYWVENLFTTFTTASRISLHYRWTHKLGHMRSHIQQKGMMSASLRGGSVLLAEYRSASLIFTLVHGIFMAALVLAFFKEMPALSQVLQGVAAVAVLELVSFGYDYGSLRSWPFARLLDFTKRRLGRVFVVHLALIFGMGVAAMTNRPTSFFWVFVALKTLVDLANFLPAAKQDPNRPPGCVSWIGKVIPKSSTARGPKDESFDAFWKRETERDLALAARDEEEISPEDRT